MKIKSIALAAVLATSAGFAAAGNVYELGDITADGALFVSSTFSKNASIDDTWKFSLTGENDVSTLLSRTFSTSVGAITSFAATISGGSIGAPTALELFSNSTSQVLSFGSNLGAGNYSLTVTGVANRNNTNYVFAADVTAVPEPTTYALLLAGLCAVGFVARRRSAV
ncbi:FxDxF family PEP-CTERM protein [Paucibacter sp. B2R-40]|uniref:FxDxF family PEP-CTERM protein n=1 Tax=Paucibacter sp. B2R-40 TaxID=2893554 RepID=UPI0021E3D1AE|nr:FxDxF family PEP-CTERM protein [Paucibacter sp. B2R-40]MCV2352682.1 FxDxF family PEP-CTERM protein [Paucibacter sp. B2R-40]